MMKEVAMMMVGRRFGGMFVCMCRRSTQLFAEAVAFT